MSHDQISRNVRWFSHEADLRWTETKSWSEPPPDCIGGLQSRDNHNGNIRNGRPAESDAMGRGLWHGRATCDKSLESLISAIIFSRECTAG